MSEYIEKMAYAHSIPGQPRERWHLLSEHLNDVAKKAEAFAADFDSGPWGRLIGLWHDLGKYSPEFQQKLLDTIGNPDKKRRVNHSSAGAQHAQQVFEKHIVPPLLFTIAGHHAGLADFQDLKSRLQNDLDYLEKIRDIISPEIFDQNAPPLPDFLAWPNAKERPEVRARQEEFWIRMLYSCLY